MYKEHICPLCKHTMIWFMDTLLCPICDSLTIEELAEEYQKLKKRKANEDNNPSNERMPIM